MYINYYEIKKINFKINKINKVIKDKICKEIDLMKK